MQLLLWSCKPKRIAILVPSIVASPFRKNLESVLGFLPTLDMRLTQNVLSPDFITLLEQH